MTLEQKIGGTIIGLLLLSLLVGMIVGMGFVAGTSAFVGSLLITGLVIIASGLLSGVITFASLSDQMKKRKRC